MLGTPVRYLGGAIEQEEQEREADGDNGTGEKWDGTIGDGKRDQKE